MPMGPGGTDVNMRTGKPMTPPKPEERAAKIRGRFEAAVQDAWNISAELHQNSAVLKIFLVQYMKRLMELGDSDPILKALEAPIRAIRETLEVRPVMAEREALRRLGPQLAALVEEETEAAP